MGLLIDRIDNFTPQSILVLGDLMLDEYCRGSVSRISPEAPIPILDVEEIEYRPGGSGACCANLRALNCRVFPVGVVGNNPEGEKIKTLLNERGVDCRGIASLDEYRTTVKRRLLTKQQQMLRMDLEQKTPAAGRGDVGAQLRGALSELMPQVSGLLISDYGKGVCDPETTAFAIRAARQAGIPVICDPAKGRDYSEYAGITGIKPNRLEGKLLLGKELNERNAMLEAAAKIKKLTGSEFVSLSLDRDGLLHYVSENEFEFICNAIKEITDVTGAGDLLVSVLVSLLADGCPKGEAAEIANHAAGVEVTKLGAAPVDWAEIRESIEKKGGNFKIIRADELAGKVGTKGNREKPLVFVNGYFDRFNNGMLKFLLELNRFYGTAVVALNSDASILRAKGREPLLKENERAEILANIHAIDWITFFDEENAVPLIKKLQPDVYVKSRTLEGRDFVELETLKKLNAEVRFLSVYD